MLQPHVSGDPLFIRIADAETLSDVKPRVQALLEVSDDTCAQWRFCFNTSFGPAGKRAGVACPGVTRIAGRVLYVYMAGLENACTVQHCMACSCPPSFCIMCPFDHADYLRDEEILSDRFPATGAKYPAWLGQLLRCMTLPAAGTSPRMLNQNLQSANKM